MARLFRTALPLLIALAGPATAQTAATTAGVAGTNLTTGGAVSLPAITATPSTSARSNDIHCADERRHIVIDGAPATTTSTTSAGASSSAVSPAAAHRAV
jgi:hypothetical protein